MYSLRRRLGLVVAVVVCLVGAFGGVATYLLVEAELEREFDRELFRELTNTVPHVAVHLFLRDRVEPPFESRPARSQDVWLEVFDDGGRSLWKTDNLGTTSLPLRGAATATARPMVALGFADVHFAPVAIAEDVNVRSVSARVVVPLPHLPTFEPGQGANRTLQVVLARRMDSVDRALTVLGWLILLVTVLSMAVAALAARFFIRRDLSPLQSVQRQVAALQSDRLDQRIRVADPPAEIAPVCEQLNLLLGRLEVAFQKEQEFAAGAAHELNTPLAALRATIDVALQDGSEAERIEALQTCQRLAVQMTSTIRALLDLLRDPQPVVAPFALEGLLVAAAADLDADRIRIETAAIPAAKGDREQVRRVVHNVLGNALTHGVGEVVVRPWSGAGQVGFEVTNAAVGAPADLGERAFDTFWRGDRSRTGDHLGLGLSLCRRIVDAHGGAIDLAVDGVTVTVRVALPAEDEL